MISISWLTLLLPLTFVSAFPLWHRGNTFCDQWGSVSTGPYTLANDLWNKDSATSGWQCTTLESINGNRVKWFTDWSWTGAPSQVKSFANVQLNEGIHQQLSAITSMPSTWHWSHSGNESVSCDVAFDLFTSYSPDGNDSNEVMIWMANFNAGPISYNYGSDGKSVPIATDIPIAGHTWDLHLGWNGVNTVWSFIPTKGVIRAFKGDIYGFLTYLTGNGHISSSEYLVTAQAGTEAMTGTSTFKTSAYELSINLAD
ncbi:glycoside hydrolase family 12 protein [Boletus edulis BED1]|uniref:Glycoside hydrolase family 12 protein n=1 Tax=Boletus edulis BED1 TaxID=1328754 RepID=A0AAD4GH40_BOLED|nr:glycoside hydrolase family 12 protein [Boletus edulis BED1]